MNRRKFLRGAQGLAVGAGLWSVKGLCREADQTPTRIERVCLIGLRLDWLAVEMLVGTQRFWLDRSRYSLSGVYWDDWGLRDRVVGYFGPIPTQAERTNVNELHAQLRAMWPAGQDVLAKSSCMTSVWR